MAETNWYVVHTYSGYENKVKANIDKTIENRHLEEQILEVRVPMQEVLEMKNGARKTVQKKLYPGYVLINMEMNDDTWLFVKNTPGITTFIGPRRKPSPIAQEEVDKILAKAKESKEKPAPKVTFEKGESIRVIEGAFLNFNGVVEEIQQDKGKVKVNVSIFGRTTPVELEFWQVEKI